MAGKRTQSPTDPISQLKAAGFEVRPSNISPSWMQASRGGCAVFFRETLANRVEMLRSPGLLRNGKIFRVLDKGYQKFLTDDQLEVPATALHLQQINFFYQDFKDAIGLPVLFNESLGALTAVTRLDGVERPVLAQGARNPKVQNPNSK
ncbi:MAG: hypothetical protein LAO21_02665 [Acidobacteriia bacterium]|nr:hypothetical protein [Terriglobia bacterium]